MHFERFKIAQRLGQFERTNIQQATDARESLEPEESLGSVGSNGWNRCEVTCELALPGKLLGA